MKYIQAVMLVYPLAFMPLTQMEIKVLPADLEIFKRLEMVSHLVEEVMRQMISQALKMMTSWHRSSVLITCFQDMEGH